MLNSLKVNVTQFDIKDLAVKRAEAVTDTDFAYVNHQEAKLSAQYLSSVSPDRKTLYKEAVQTIRGEKQNKEYSEGEKTLIDYLNEKDDFVSRLKNGKHIHSLVVVLLYQFVIQEVVMIMLLV